MESRGRVTTSMRAKLLVQPEALDARWVRRTFVLGLSTLALLLAGVLGFVDGVVLDGAQATLTAYDGKRLLGLIQLG